MADTYSTSAGMGNSGLQQLNDWSQFGTVPFQKVRIEPAPQFSFGEGKPSLATIYSSHYHRLEAVVDAARSGNERLIRLALAEYDKWGGRDEDEAQWRKPDEASES